MSTQTTTAGTRGSSLQGGVRSRADAAYRVLATIMMPVIAVQFALAGLGAFGAMGAGGAGYGPHELVGTAIGVLSVLLLVAALVARVSTRTVLLTALLFVLAAPGQPLLASFGHDDAWIGALHALSGVVILGLTGWLGAEARRRRR